MTMKGPFSFVVGMSLFSLVVGMDLFSFVVGMDLLSLVVGMDLFSLVVEVSLVSLVVRVSIQLLGRRLVVEGLVASRMTAARGRIDSFGVTDGFDRSGQGCGQRSRNGRNADKKRDDNVGMHC